MKGLLVGVRARAALCRLISLIEHGQRGGRYKRLPVEGTGVHWGCGCRVAVPLIPRVKARMRFACARCISGPGGMCGGD